MCGIGGIWERAGGRAEHLDLRRMMSAMGHRGPEGAAFGRMDGGALLLGFLLLGFTDGGLAQQPLYNEDHTVALVYNGEIYDFAPLREDLERRGHRFRTASDSEVVIHLYEQHGLRCFEHMNGEFSFALWDGRARELVLARDRFGVKPLQYAFHGGRFAFASEAKGLHALSGPSAALDPAYWTGPGVGIAAGAMTPFRGIASVRPGHVMRVSRDRVREDPYFRPTFGPGARAPSLDEAATRVRDTLARAVRRRLDGDPPIALSLSSGIDSTIVCGLMADDLRRRGRSFTAFSIGYDGVAYDESAVARRAAAHFGVGFERVVCTAEGLADGLLPGIHATETATNSLSTTARLELTRAVRRAGSKALMSGEGSDELFGGYPYFGVEAIWRLLAGDAGARALGERAFAEFRQTEARSRGVFWEDGDAWRRAPPLFGYPSAYHLRIRRVSRAMRWMFSRDWLDRMGTEAPLRTATRELSPALLRGLSPFDATRLVSRSVLGSLVIPSLGDRVEMAHSLEGRVPYLDRDLIDLAYSFPEAHCIDPRTLTRKRVLRRAFEGFLPPGHTSPPKHTLMAPSFADLARAPHGRELFEVLLDDGAVRRAGIFDRLFVRGLRAAWRAWPEGDRRHAMLDLTLAYVASTQALHLVHVEDLLGKRGAAPHLALDEDRSPPPGAPR